MTSDKKIVGDVNDHLGKFTVNKYEAHIPYGAISEMLEESGFKPFDPEDVPFMLLGHEGKVSIQFIHPEYEGREFYLQLSWYRMPSGNFETVAGFHSTGKRRGR